ncbi:putative xylosidase/arabinosidase [Thelonectria olida]|uniref:Xylosidase/arabinosidase n=1 Tax=Thelonectria olida TaxID=1576542 RepID=A0A9P9AJW1_9HYPO|nr:putative xylosidase/arabinosidase [Thelonectria olida]
MERVRVNPVIPGFAPDPSLVYVDGTYFLVNSSFHLFPGLPVYASKDLREWKHIGNALNRTRQLSLQHSVTKLIGPDDPDEKICAQGGLYAPTIRYRNGTFYIVCTNVIHTRSQSPSECERQNFILSTTDIWADKWSDPVFYDFDAIDTSLFWDDDDRVYVVGAAPPTPDTKIRQFEIDLKTGKKLSDEKLLWEGISKVYPEGPHMYKKDGWYYLLIAEGGCFADHHTIMARSRDIWGPYEVNSANPVLEKADPNGSIHHTGHGDLFQNPSGQWYFVCLGVRKNNGRFIMGRESVLTTATWPKGEFPVIDPVQRDVPLAIKQNPSSDWPVRRNPDRLNVAFVHIRDPVEENYEYDGSSITLTSSKADLSQPDVPVTFTGKRQRRLDGSASATLESLAQSATDCSRLRTGLCYYKDEHRFFRIFLDVNSKELVLEIVNRARSIEQRTSRSVGALGKGAKVTFGVDYSELEFVLWFSVVVDDAAMKEELGRIDTLDMTGYDFVGPIIGIYAVSDKEVEVRYSEFLMEDM